jgi:O-antigen/teichoic acid export membrane protein
LESDLKLKKSIYYFLPNLVSGCASLVTLPILTRYLTPKDFGVFALAQGFSSLVIGLLDFGVSNTYERNFFEHSEKSEKSGLFHACAAYILATGIIGGALSVLIPLFFPGYFQDENVSVWFLSVVVGVTALRSLNQLYYTYYRNSEMPRTYAAFGVSEFLLNVGFSIIAVAALKRGVMGWALAQLFGYVVLSSAQSLGLMRKIGVAFSKPLLVKTLKIGYPLTLRQGLNVVSNQFDKFVLGTIGSTYFVGIYNIGERIGNLFFMFITALGQIFVPELYRKLLVEKGKSPEHLGDFLAPYFFTCCIVALGINLFTEELFYFILDPKFFQAVTVSELLVISMLFLFFQKISSVQLMAAKHTGKSAIFAVANVALVFGLGWPLTYWFGYMGTAVATVFVRFFNSLLFMYIAHESTPIFWRFKKFGFPIITLIFTTGLIIKFADATQLRPIWILLKLVLFFAFIFAGRWFGFSIQNFKESKVIEGVL